MSDRERIPQDRLEQAFTMDESVRALDYSETSLKRDIPVILAALRKPVESSYRSRDFRNHLCFIPQSCCTTSDFSVRNTPAFVGERESSKRLCQQNVSAEHVDDLIFGSPVDFQISDESSTVAGVQHATKGSSTTAHEPRTKQLREEYTRLISAISSTSPSEISEQTTAETGRGSSDDVVPLPCATAVQHRETPHNRGEARAETSDRTEHKRSGNTQDGLDDFIPCLFYRWPLSDTLIVHFHGFDEDLGKTALYLERLHQQLEVNVLSMEYPGYGICIRLPRDPDGDTNELFYERGTRSAFFNKSVSSHQTEDFKSKKSHPEVLPQQCPPESIQVVGGRQAEILYDQSNCICEEDAASSVRKDSLSAGAGSAMEEASRQISSSSFPDYPRIVASCRRLLLFVLKHLEVAPQCIFLSAIKSAAGLVIELCRFAEDLLGADVSLGGLILLQPLFVFPCSSPRITDPENVRRREKSASPRRPVRGVKAGEHQGGSEHFTSSQQRQNIVRKISLPDTKDQQIVAEELDISSTRAPDSLPTCQIGGRLDTSNATRQSGNSYHLTKKVGAPAVLEEVCTMSSLDTTIDPLQECKEETCHSTTATQAERSAAKEAPGSFQTKTNTRVFQLSAESPTTDAEQNFFCSDFSKTPHRDHTCCLELMQAEPSSPLLLGAGVSPVVEPNPVYEGGSTHRGSGIRAAAGDSPSHDRSITTNSTVVPPSAFPLSRCQTKDVCITCNTPVSSPTSIRLPPPATQLSSTSARSKNFQSSMNGSSSVIPYSKNDNSGPPVSLDRLTLSTSSRVCDAFVQSKPQLDSATGDVSATCTEADEDDIIFNSKSLYSSSKETDSLSASTDLGFDTPAGSFFERIRCFFLPSFTMFSQDEPEEGGRTAAIAQAALQLSRRKKLERRRRTAAALEGVFGIKQAIQRVSAVKCSILFLAHRAVQQSHSSRARRRNLYRSPDSYSGGDNATDSSSTSLSSSESDTSAFLSNPDLTEAFNSVLGEGGSVLAEPKVTQKPNEDESVSADSSSVYTSAQEGERIEQCITGVGESISFVPRTEHLGDHGCAQDVEEGEDGTRNVMDGKTLSPEECSSFEQQRYNCRHHVEKFGRTRRECTGSSRRSNSFLHDKPGGTCLFIPKQNRHGPSRHVDQKKTESGNDRVAEDLVVDRSIGLLMAHAVNYTKNEVFTTFQLDTEFFSKVRAFIQRCRKTERRRQQLQQLAALRAPINMRPKKVADTHCRIESSLEEQSQVRGRKEVVKKFISPIRLRDPVKSGSRCVHASNANTVCVPLELFRVPAPFKDREEALNRAYAQETPEDDDDRENLIAEQSWVHKTLEICAKQLNLLAAAERAA